jgi:hypothetical protein
MGKLPKYKTLQQLYNDQYGREGARGFDYYAPEFFRYQVNYKLVSTRDLLYLLASVQRHTNYFNRNPSRAFKIKAALKAELALRENITRKIK